MVLGLSAKTRKGPSVHVDYLIHIQEIKPWPPSQSLRSLRSVLIQWENGERNSGSTNSVVPSNGSAGSDGKIEFNTSFRLPVTLVRDSSVKGRETDAFLKNCLEFNLHETRRDKTQLLATATIDLADHGVIKEAVSLTAPMNSKRSYRNTAQPVLFFRIQPVKRRTSSSSREDLTKEVSLEKNDGESVSSLINEEDTEEAEIASFTDDDDDSSHSSLPVSSTAMESNEASISLNESDALSMGHSSASKNVIGPSSAVPQTVSNGSSKRSSSRSSSIDLSSDVGSSINAHVSVSNSSNTKSITKSASTHSIHSSSSSFTNESMVEEPHINMSRNGLRDLVNENHKNVANGRILVKGSAQQNGEEDEANPVAVKVAGSHDTFPVVEKTGFTNSDYSEGNREENRKAQGFVEDPEENEQERRNLEDERHYTRDTHSSGIENHEVKGKVLEGDILKQVKSVRSSVESAKINGAANDNPSLESTVGVVAPQDFQKSAVGPRINTKKDAKVYPKETRTTVSESKIQQLESKIKMLEGELTEAATIEAALYSVVAEHGSSMSKVHAPARRLSRLYLHACKGSSQHRRGSAARSAVSGLVLVAKACGNDVPRLTFWLSNSVVLRAIIGQAAGDLKPLHSAGTPRNSAQRGNKNISSSLRWKESSPRKLDNKMFGSFCHWEDPHTFTVALEKVEAWIFSRIIESIWWQTLTPHMQSGATKVVDNATRSTPDKKYGRMSSSRDQSRENISLDLWKKAFKDACERLCPLRAGGHECGCLPELARLIMEQCVARLDVAMFNAILRESGDEIPTDPVSDPISDSKVLPVPSGKSSFGSGAQLKNAIGNWSRWLTDLFGIDDDDDEGDVDDNNDRNDNSFKSFYLLNALSDLMMLPKDMLLDRSIRKEVCPTFGAPLIRRILDGFVPDEFCPDPIPADVLEALESEDPDEVEEESITNFPCIAAPPVYAPPSAAFIANIIGEFGSQPQFKRSGSSILRKSYTSDDELDELNSPLDSIFVNSAGVSPVVTNKPSRGSRELGDQSAIRYDLLRDVWMTCE